MGRGEGGGGVRVGGRGGESHLIPRAVWFVEYCCATFHTTEKAAYCGDDEAVLILK